MEIYLLDTAIHLLNNWGQNSKLLMIISVGILQITLTLKMTTTQVVETSVTVNNSPIQNYIHLDGHIPPTYEMTPRFRPFTV